MRHRIFGRQLGRTRNERQALFRSQVRDIFTHGGIQTTEAKAKSVLPIVEKLCAMTKKSELLGRREFAKYIQDRNLVNSIFNQVKAAFADQSGNYTKMSRIKRRQGDDALIVKLSLVKPISALPVKAEEVKETKVEAPKAAPKKAAAKKPVAKKEVKAKKETK
ncbi:MAG TPA: 50S ribosomal protein L17 [Patescibacteria group bacterium]